MSTEDNVRQVIKPHLPHRAKHRAANAELADLPFVDDAARRLGASAQALFEYFARLNALRAAANDIGHAALAERAVRAELHTRIALSSGLDALNELHDLGLLQQAMQTAIKTPADITRTTLPDAARRAMAVLGQRYPDQLRCSSPR
jgi:hypothetical protein